MSLVQTLLQNLQPLQDRLQSQYLNNISNLSELKVVKKLRLLNQEPCIYPNEFIKLKQISSDLISIDWNQFYIADNNLTSPSIVIEDKSCLSIDLSNLPDGINVTLVNCNNISLYSSTPRLFSDQLITVQNSQVVQITSLHLSNSSSLYVVNSEDVCINSCRFDHLKLSGIVLRYSLSVELTNLVFYNCLLSCIFVGEGVSNYRISLSTFDSCCGRSNWHAPVVVSGRNNIGNSSNLEDLFASDSYWVKAQMLYDMLNSPTKGFIQDNKIIKSKSSGIYLDGAINLIVEGNTITDSSKEGICLDYGCFNVLVVGNLITSNGDRYGKTDDDLQKDFVFNYGRDSRGSAKAKLPGVSIDNSAFCQILSNHIVSNFGSGLKMVRAGFCNLVAYNHIMSNNVGQNDVFHFFGIELGSAPADVAALDLDFCGSCHNIIAQNIITGRHYSGIFLTELSVSNFICDNIILASSSYSVESLKFSPSNEFLNNYGNSPSRNSSLSGLAPYYQGAGLPVFD